MTSDELTIRHAQTHQPWTVPYTPALVACQKRLPHLYASHATLHAAKSVGKLAAVFEAMDHKGGRVLSDEQMRDVRAMSADLVTAALRIANLYGFDLAAELCQRVEEKNGVSILEGG